MVDKKCTQFTLKKKKKMKKCQKRRMLAIKKIDDLCPSTPSRILNDRSKIQEKLNDKTI